jgi:hypothetical protein
VIHDPVPPEEWAAEATRIAHSLEDVAAAVVVGSDDEVSLIVAFAMARAQRDGRRVAIGDLVGGLPGLSPRDGSPGLLECFRDGVQVSDIARPLDDDASIFTLPSGDGAVAERWVFESARWTRLVAGFREVDALLLLVAPAGAPGLDTLIAAVDGVVAVDLPPAIMRSWPLLATVDRPEPDLPPIVTPARPGMAAPAAPLDRTRLQRRARRRALQAVGLLAVLALGAFAAMRIGPRTDDRTEGTGADSLPAGTFADVASARRPAMPADTITLDPIVNPDDSAIAANFTVELVAANTLAGANSRLAMRGEKLPAPTISPVLLGSDGRPWYRALTGAWQRRDEASDWLDALRERGLVRHDVGRVMRAPLALRLAEGVRVAEAPMVVARWQARGIPAYALMQDDGSARVYAGAFETSGQAALLAKSLRDLGDTPVLAFRTGRTF